MKWTLLLILLPFFTAGQTVHVKDGKIEYKKTVKVNGLSKEALYERGKKALELHVKDTTDEIDIDTNEPGLLKSTGKIRLRSRYSIIKTVHYTMTLNIVDGEYSYKIDSVYLREKERGGKIKITPSEDLVKDMEVSGVVAVGAEKQLNEIDMRFQKVIALVNKTILVK